MGFRFKLILTYAGVIFLTLLLSALLFAFIIQQLQQDQRREAEQRLSRQTLAVQNRIIPICPSNSDCVALLSRYREVLVQYAGFIDARILIVDESGVVRVDTDSKNTIKDKTLSDYKLVIRDSVPHYGQTTFNETKYSYFALPGPDFILNTDISQSGSRFTSDSTRRTVQTDLVLSVPQATLEPNWNNFIGGAVLAGLVALGLAVIAAIFIARSVARPLIRITRASEAIAQGDYSQQLPEPKEANGKDEMGRLAVTFNRMAREVARSQQTMRDFVANVSHELKTPLTSIQGFSQAILDGTADDRASLEHSVAVINHEAARMRRLVDELLDLSRIESGQVEMARRDVDLERLLTRVVSKLDPQAVQKQVYIHPYLQAYRQQPELQALSVSNAVGNGPLIMGDADRLEQIFTNILDNAIKYSPMGGEVSLKLYLSGTEAAKPINVNTSSGRYYWAVVEISNRGPYIPPDQQFRIFERFYKMDKSRAKRRGESTGLGLAIAKELVEAHKGTIALTSQPLEQPTLYSMPDFAEPQTGLTVFIVSLPLLALPIFNSQPMIVAMG